MFGNHGESESKNIHYNDIARLCGVAVSSVSDYIRKHDLKPTEIGDHNAKLFTYQDFKQIKDYYENKARNQAKTTRTDYKDELIRQLKSENEMLRQQLAIKDKQIAESHKLITQVNQLSSQTNKIASQAQQLDLIKNNHQITLTHHTRQHKRRQNNHLNTNHSFIAYSITRYSEK